ncbi:MAG: 3'(2'),5'-bisphosphate nucleotidase [Thermoanaerobaculales bacterium]|nr:3'(2'),5'-bisphosphate nucleotidase [Thermoanaerobaculales bacterium]
MYEAERKLALKIVGEACGLASTVQRKVVAQADSFTKGDRSPVTMADLAIQAVVSRRLKENFPTDLLLAEEDSGALVESPDMAAKVLDLTRSAIPDIDGDEVAVALDRGDHEGGSGRYWVLDPVDGTKGFLRGQHFAVALALVDEGQVVVGVLGCPNLATDPSDPSSEIGCLFAAVRNEGAIQKAIHSGEEKVISTKDSSNPSDAVMCESVESAHAAHSEHAQITATLGITSEPYRIDSQCKYAIVGRGEASIYLRLPSAKGYREKVWDHAAGALVIEEAGGKVTDLDGNPLDLASGRFLGVSRGIIATNGNFHEKVLEAARNVVIDS